MSWFNAPRLHLAVYPVITRENPSFRRRRDGAVKYVCET